MNLITIWYELTLLLTAFFSVVTVTWVLDEDKFLLNKFLFALSEFIGVVSFKILYVYVCMMTAGLLNLRGSYLAELWTNWVLWSFFLIFFLDIVYKDHERTLFHLFSSSFYGHQAIVMLTFQSSLICWWVKGNEPKVRDYCSILGHQIR